MQHYDEGTCCRGNKATAVLRAPTAGDADHRRELMSRDTPGWTSKKACGHLLELFSGCGNGDVHAIALVRCTKRLLLGQTSGQTPETSVPDRSPAVRLGPFKVFFPVSLCLHSLPLEQVARKLGIRLTLVRMLAKLSSVERCR